MGPQLDKATDINHTIFKPVIAATGIAVLLGAVIRILAAFMMDVGPQDVIPILESSTFTGTHDPFSFMFGLLTRLIEAPLAAWWFRLPPLVASIVTIASVGRWTRREIGPIEGFLVALMLAVALNQVQIAATVRSYAIHVLGIWLIVSALAGLAVGRTDGRQLVVGAILSLGHQWTTLFTLTALVVWAVNRTFAPRKNPGQLFHTPEAQRSGLAALLIIGTMSAMWIAEQFQIPMKTAYQSGSPHIFVGRFGMYLQGLWVTGRLLSGGGLLAGLGFFGIAAIGGISLAGTRPGRWLMATGAVYLAIPLVVDVGFGSMGHQVGHSTYLSVPLAILAARGAVRLVEWVFARHQFLTQSGLVRILTTLGCVATVFLIPNISSDVRLLNRGFPLGQAYAWKSFEKPIAELMTEDDLIVARADDFFVAVHFFAFSFMDRRNSMAFASDNLPQPALIRSFLLREFSYGPGRGFALHRWQNFDGFVNSRWAPSGRVVVFLPNPEPQSIDAWLSNIRTTGTCIDEPVVPEGVTLRGTDNGYVAWFDRNGLSVPEVMATAKTILTAHERACPQRYRRMGNKPRLAKPGS